MMETKGTHGTTPGGTGYTVYDDLAYVPDAEELQKLDFYVPDGKTPAGGWPLVAYAHPGGFTAGDKADARMGSGFALLALDHGFALASVNYRLPGNQAEHIAMELADVQAALRWIVSRAGALGVDPTKLACAGVSAGGALVSAAAVRAKRLGEPQVFAVVSAVSPYDITKATDYIDKDTPPFFMIHGNADRIVDFSQAEAFAAALAAADIPHVLVTVGDAAHPVDHFDVLNVYNEQGKLSDPFVWLREQLAGGTADRRVTERRAGDRRAADRRVSERRGAGG